MKSDEQEDVDFEPEDDLGDVGAAKAKIAKLREELEKVKKERQEYLDGWQRAKADMINARQELLRQAQRTGERAVESFVEDLIPAIDGFDLAAGSPSWETVAPEWRSGVDQIRNQLLDALSRQGIKRFGKIGEKFEHSLHEAVQETDEMPGEPGTIVRILRYGYKMSAQAGSASGGGERVIRPAQVIVKK